MTIPFWQPAMTGGEMAQLERSLRWPNEGDLTAEFETQLSKRLGVSHVICTTSGTMALFLALKASGLQKGDRVIVPDLTFIATANAVVLAGGVPVLVDVEPNRLTMRLSARGGATAVPVHVNGRIADAPGRLTVIEDACEAPLAQVFGRAACVSFSPNKTITTGQGGAVLTDDLDIAARVRMLKDHGRLERGADDHPTVGFNAKFTDLQAAVGLAQLSALDDRLARQRAIQRRYADRLADVDGVTVLPFEPDETPQWTDVLAARRDALDAFLAGRGMVGRKFWRPLHTQLPYASSTRFPVATDASARGYWLPSAFTLTDDEIDAAAAAVREFYADRV